MGHFRQINPLPTLSACPLRSDRVRPFRTAAIRRRVPRAAVSRCSNMRVQKPDLLDHLVGGGKQSWRHGETKDLCRL
jgi:hypothetical protein